MAYSCDLCLQSLAEIQRGDWGGGGGDREREIGKENKKERELTKYSLSVIRLPNMENRLKLRKQKTGVQYISENISNQANIALFLMGIKNKDCKTNNNKRKKTNKQVVHMTYYFFLA